MKLFLLKITIVIFLVGCEEEGKTPQPIKEKVLTNMFLPEFDTYIVIDVCDSILTIDLPDSNATLKLHLNNCEGRMNIEMLDSNQKVSMKGQYLESLDSLKKYIIGKSAIDGKSKISVFTYFQPLPHGVWNYYKNDKLINTVNYSMGIRLKE